MANEVLVGSDEADFQEIWAGLPAYCSTCRAESLQVVEESLKDTAAIRAYQRAILHNPHLFHGQTVLDVACGVGILGFFALRAGAKHVIAIDEDDVVTIARDIADQSGYSARMTFLRGKVGELTLPVAQVDVIVSQWMGYFLLHENKLETLILARERWLKRGGLMFPDRARMFLAAAEDARYKEEKVEFWGDVYGVDMSAMRRLSLFEPLIDTLEPANLLSSSCPVLEVDLHTLQIAEIPFTSTYALQVHKKEFMHALVAWFEVGFFHCHRPVTLSTSPRFKETRWKQTIFYLDHAQPVSEGEVVTGSIAVRPNSGIRRAIDIKLSYHLLGEVSFDGWQFFRLR